MSISEQINGYMNNSSFIRKMFEEGTKLKAEIGEDNVFDFSIGNPDLSPPGEFYTSLENTAKEKIARIHGYMPNAGYLDVRQAMAKRASKEQSIKLDAECIIMTCGAAGGLNTALKTILDPMDEVIVPVPYFVEYPFFISNHNGRFIPVEVNEDFTLNIQNIENAISNKTKAVLINSPNNPTGKIYSKREIGSLAKLLESYNRDIFLISDEPYRNITYDDIEVPGVLEYYQKSIVVTSFSKSLSIPGERIGYIAVSPVYKGFKQLVAGLIFSNRILGYVNAPAFMQRVVAKLEQLSIDITPYKRRRDMLYEGLKNAGYEVEKPEGAFYIFCRSPIDDDIRFVQHLQTHAILAVPGSGFGKPGYFRIAFCVSDEKIKHSISKFSVAIKSIK